MESTSLINSRNVDSTFSLFLAEVSKYFNPNSFDNFFPSSFEITLLFEQSILFPTKYIIILSLPSSFDITLLVQSILFPTKYIIILSEASSFICSIQFFICSKLDKLVTSKTNKIPFAPR